MAILVEPEIIQLSALSQHSVRLGGFARLFQVINTPSLTVRRE